MGKNAASGNEKTRTGARQPAYRRILEQLRQRISRGDYAVGDKLPTDEMLMSEFGVCRYTARAAIQPLVDDDIVRRYRGRGSFVVATPETSSQWALTSLDDLIDYSFAHTVRVERSGAVETRDFPAAAVAMGKIGPSVHRLLVVREDKTAPYTCSEIFLPPDLMRRVPTQSLSGQLQGQVVRLLERHGRLRVHRARQVALAEAASGEIARLLQVAEGTPLLVLERSYATRDGRVIEYARVYCRPDRYRQTVEFRRHRSQDEKRPPRGH